MDLIEIQPFQDTVFFEYFGSPQIISSINIINTSQYNKIIYQISTNFEEFFIIIPKFGILESLEQRKIKIYLNSKFLKDSSQNLKKANIQIECAEFNILDGRNISMNDLFFEDFLSKSENTKKQTKKLRIIISKKDESQSPTLMNQYDLNNSSILKNKKFVEKEENYQNDDNYKRNEKFFENDKNSKKSHIFKNNDNLKLSNYQNYDDTENENHDKSAVTTPKRNHKIEEISLTNSEFPKNFTFYNLESNKKANERMSQNSYKTPNSLKNHQINQKTLNLSNKLERKLHDTFYSEDWELDYKTEKTSYKETFYRSEGISNETKTRKDEIQKSPKKVKKSEKIEKPSEITNFTQKKNEILPLRSFISFGKKEQGFSFDNNSRKRIFDPVSKENEQNKWFRDYEGVLIKKEHFHEKLTEINKGTNKPHLTKERIITNDQFILDSSPYMKFHEKTDNRLEYQEIETPKMNEEVLKELVKNNEINEKIEKIEKIEKNEKIEKIIEKIEKIEKFNTIQENLQFRMDGNSFDSKEAPRNSLSFWHSKKNIKKYDF